jgi:predicted metalloprotease
MDIERRTSTNIIDRRHVIGGALGALLASLVAVFMGGGGRAKDPDDDLVAVTSTALDRGDAFWEHQNGSEWRSPHVVLIPTAGEPTPCGKADEATGPFYCPVNERIYVDVKFLRAIHGDLARAYVTAHELGHHVQKLRRELDGRPSVDIELGADCYAGRWIADEQNRGHLGAGDVETALAEAAAVGDDRLCPGCSPEQWTHGPSWQRVDAVKRGISGATCNQEPGK